MQFQTLSTSIDVSFWKTLSQKKLDEYKLSDQSQAICGGEQQGWLHVPGRIMMGSFSFMDTGSAVPFASFQVPGTLFNTNRIEDFRGLDKVVVLRQCAEKIWNAITTGEATKNPILLHQFVLLTYADLKQHKYYFWFGFPALIPKEAAKLASPPVALSEKLSANQINSLLQQYQHLAFEQSEEKEGTEAALVPAPACCFFLVAFMTDGRLGCHPLSAYTRIYEDSNVEKVWPAFVDSCAISTAPGWALRNFLVLLTARFKIMSPVTILSFRDVELALTRRSDVDRLDVHSVVMTVNLPTAPLEGFNEMRVVGWAKNTRGKFGPNVMNLKQVMDPRELAASSVDLNLKLMRWRLAPELNLAAVRETKCLLLGAGTLGCNIARSLLGWGVRHITFVDNGKVSFSNPVRQSLYTFNDCLDGGRFKAEAAAKAVQSIFPSAHSVGHVLTIPMPGHAMGGAAAKEAEAACSQLYQLFKDHDVVFLGTDSRESRWLPTVLGADINRFVINAALGFDTFMVMRHGARPKNEEKAEVQLGCYFCNDVTGPADSVTSRTLDQQCTVTRPGLAPMVSALGVELMVMALQHSRAAAAAHMDKCTLGCLPHQLRGSLRDFSVRAFESRRFENCLACGPDVLAQWRAHGTSFVLDVLNDPLYLERLTGLLQMKAVAEATAADWMEDGWDSDEGEL